jgi:putative ABC transport system permease protein
VALALGGGALGLLLAFWGVRALRWLGPQDLPRAGGVAVNGWVLAFSLGVSLLAGLLSGLAPALAAARSDLRTWMRRGTGAEGSRSRLGTRGVLIAAETALGVVVLVGAGLVLRSFLRLEQVSPGFQAQRVLTLRVILRGPAYATLAARTRFQRRLCESIAALPGVESVGAVTFLPLTGARNETGVAIAGRDRGGAGQPPQADFAAITPGYLHSLRIPLLAGRDLSWRDTAGSLPVAIVDEAMARTFWPGEDPVGKRLAIASPGPAASPPAWRTVVGVVGPVRTYDLETAPRPTVYVPNAQNDDPRLLPRDMAVRARADPLALAPAVRAAVWALDRDLSVARLRSMEQVRGAAIATRRFSLLLLELFAGLALVLAAVGLYAVTAWAVTQRTSEIGLRVALGARPRQVLALLLLGGARPAVIGLGLGLAAALALARLLASQLYAVSASDPATFAAVAALLLAVTLAACWLPGRRALRIDPMIALRHE